MENIFSSEFLLDIDIFLQFHQEYLLDQDRIDLMQLLIYHKRDQVSTIHQT